MTLQVLPVAGLVTAPISKSVMNREGCWAKRMTRLSEVEPASSPRVLGFPIQAASGDAINIYTRGQRTPIGCGNSGPATLLRRPFTGCVCVSATSRTDVPTKRRFRPKRIQENTAGDVLLCSQHLQRAKYPKPGASADFPPPPGTFCSFIIILPSCLHSEPGFDP